MALPSHEPLLLPVMTTILTFREFISLPFVKNSITIYLSILKHMFEESGFEFYKWNHAYVFYYRWLLSLRFFHVSVYICRFIHFYCYKYSIVWIYHDLFILFGLFPVFWQLRTVVHLYLSIQSNIYGVPTMYQAPWLLAVNWKAYIKAFFPNLRSLSWSWSRPPRANSLYKCHSMLSNVSPRLETTL